MYKKMGVVFTGILIFFMIGFVVGGCQPGAEDIDTGVEDEQEETVQAEGLFIGQIDSHSVEVEVEGRAEAFGLAEGLDVSAIESGSKVAITYEDHEERPVLQSIKVIEEPAEEIFQEEGLYVGRIDSRSVEIEINGEYRAFAIDQEAVVEDLIDGSTIAFTYREGEHRPVLMSVEVIEEPDYEEIEENMELEGKGIYVGQIDSQSIEVVRSRAFALGEEISVENIADGAKVAFTYAETGDGPILDYIEAVDSPPEGAVISGRFIGQKDSHSVEIEYEQVFTLGEGVSVEGIDEGKGVTFTYREGPARPVIISISPF